VRSRVVVSISELDSVQTTFMAFLVSRPTPKWVISAKAQAHYVLAQDMHEAAVGDPCQRGRVLRDFRTQVVDRLALVVFVEQQERCIRIWVYE
jgi:hypothetical protein